jgi:hypothetical protein
MKTSSKTTINVFHYGKMIARHSWIEDENGDVGGDYNIDGQTTKQDWLIVRIFNDDGEVESFYNYGGEGVAWEISNA